MKIVSIITAIVVIFVLYALVFEREAFNKVADGTDIKRVVEERLEEKSLGTKVDLEVGDMLVYSGCELEHWREPFEGDSCGQVFLHYNHVNGPYATNNLFDGRPKLGVPKFNK